MVKIDIITYCSGYDYKIFDRFVGSLNDTGFSGKIYIIVNENDKPTIMLLKKKYKNVYPINDNLHKTTHINCHRFFCIELLLHKLTLDCDYLLVCDSRDVLFQKNIEDYPYDKKVDIYGFLEDITFEKEKNYNTPWIRMIENILNEQIYDKICYNKVICCGTTIGKKDSIIKYIKMMCHFIKNYNIVYNLDQGLHNYMLYLNKLECNIKLLSNEDNLVNTVGCSIHKLNENNLIVNKNNEVSWIVHQYDRFSLDLKSKMSIKYDYTC
jgi:hypothetical protein